MLPEAACQEQQHFIQSSELAQQKAKSQPQTSQHSSTISSWTQAEPGHFFCTAGACLLVSNETDSIYSICWHGPTYTQKTEATFLAYKHFD